MDNSLGFSEFKIPITLEQLDKLQSITIDLSKSQLLWISGYIWGIANKNTFIKEETPIITIISASQTGNARRLAQWFNEQLKSAKLNTNLINASNYKFKKIQQEKILILIISTQGEGEPPEESTSLYKFLMSKRAPKMTNTSFAVFGLGDSSYEFFSKAGKDFDKRLDALGAKRLINRVDADINYEDQKEKWCNLLINQLKYYITNNLLKQDKKNFIQNVNKNIGVDYTKNNPFNACCLVNQKITGKNSEKDIRHIEIDISKSNIYYYPGDALGIWYKNNTNLISEILNLVGLKGNEKVKIQNKILLIKDALKKHFELTKNSKNIVKKYAILSKNNNLFSILNDNYQLTKYSNLYPIVDMIRLNPSKLTPEQLISLLRPLTPRLYSISSSQNEVENEIHITVNIVSFYIENYFRGGGASTWLSNCIEGDMIDIFIERNDHFRLPLDHTLPIIMIGAGTGISPFRAFMQQREYDGASGKNWLFFGNHCFTEDFLYQLEWQEYIKKGLLNKISLAWSRDQSEKIYIQDKIRDNGNDVWYWIKEGAHIYICGNANSMAKDVEKVLLEIIARHGHMNFTKAEDFLNDLRIEHRYKRDVY
ncbi:sulfite reductase subunit alpha [Candidatus Pantoea edessiphila]|uniref:Sulfite reductase [NADPH] flavoprotein alpha-component n=1 Tax=Candidatus Pantoea edessiphila TaxID=2044610 RepID=A0A2P5SXN2_9GAMM|nr:NADPH-dependent assimilatory sulfite reductase flavoprotein subunit [Candidatus Pantoea edessiphila]MBK4775685.1 NADPH-dependent assimilatory sulfite reductase flavoprotein subunit [Pantoea sp. Edef]PPI87084.1 sulfite reductase subunit alpha [Candidatus Pantoea edessiphila]